MTETRYLVLCHSNMASRFYLIGDKLYDGTDRGEADNYFLYSRKALAEKIVLYVIDERSPAGRELSSRQ